MGENCNKCILHLLTANADRTRMSDAIANLDWEKAEEDQEELVTHILEEEGCLPKETKNMILESLEEVKNCITEKDRDAAEPFTEGILDTLFTTAVLDVGDLCQTGALSRETKTSFRDLIEGEIEKRIRAKTKTKKLTETDAEGQIRSEIRQELGTWYI